MAQIYASYLGKFLDTVEVSNFWLVLLSDEALSDWQKMWALAAPFSQVKPGSDKGIDTAVKIIKKDANRHDALACSSSDLYRSCW